MLKHACGVCDWYRRRSLFFTISWNSCALAIVVIGIATSVLTAIDEKIFVAPKLLLILLPAVSSLGAILTQFRLRELARIRDEGRIVSVQLTLLSPNRFTKGHSSSNAVAGPLGESLVAVALEGINVVMWHCEANQI